jgi:hypothetical protein
MADPTGRHHHDASSKFRNLLDLEAVALQQIVAFLDPEDRKNFALTCKTLATIVRSQWKTLIINMLDDDVRVPSTLSQFRSLETVVWTDGGEPTEGTLTQTDWETNPSLEVPDKRAVPELNNKQVERLKKINDLISQALEIPRPSSLDDIPEGPDEDDDAEVETHRGLMRRLAPISNYMKDMVQHMRSNAYEDTSLAEQLEGLVNVEDLTEEAVFAPAPEDSDDEAMEEGAEGAGAGDQQQDQGGAGGAGAGAGNNNNSAASNTRTAANIPIKNKPPKVLPSGRPLRLIIAAPLMFSGFDFQTFLYHTRFSLDPASTSLSSPIRSRGGTGLAAGGASTSAGVSPSPSSLLIPEGSPSLDTMLSKIWAESHPLPLPFTEIDIGWFESDGSLPSLTTRGTATWCVHSAPFITNPNQFQLLKQLRICIRNCEADMDETAVAFGQHVLPSLNSRYMPSLRELHLGRSFSFGQHLDFDPRRLDLPQLTKLVLNEMVCFNEFEQFTHLKSLKTLGLSMPAAGFESQPQDLSSLASLKDLRSLRVEFWQVEDPQDIAALQQLTELELEGIEGRIHFLKPNRPMPNLAGVTLTKTPHHQDMRYREDSKFARWMLRHAAQVFPGVEVLHLGTLGSAPAAVSMESELSQAASVVDMHVRNLLAAGGNANLQYLQLDTVLNITEDELDKRCETGSVQVYATIEVPVVSAEVLPPPSTPVVAAPVAVAAVEAAAGEDGAEGNDRPEGTTATEATPALSTQHHEDDDDDEEMDDATKAAILEAASTGLVVLWERTVEFVTCDLTDVLVAEFHYSRVGS